MSELFTGRDASSLQKGEDGFSVKDVITMVTEEEEEEKVREKIGSSYQQAAYATALRTVSLHGPTLFGPVINRAADLASESLNHSQNKYLILLIITDGVINGFRETKDALVRASSLPLSVLIVGVGGADFKAMEILDADNGKRLESSTGQTAVRDIVQFVAMRELQGETSITQALLEELPAQFLSYMKLRNFKPLFTQHENM